VMYEFVLAVNADVVFVAVVGLAMLHGPTGIDNLALTGNIARCIDQTVELRK